MRTTTTKTATRKPRTPATVAVTVIPAVSLAPVTFTEFIGGGVFASVTIQAMTKHATGPRMDRSKNWHRLTFTVVSDAQQPHRIATETQTVATGIASHGSSLLSGLLRSTMATFDNTDASAINTATREITLRIQPDATEEDLRALLRLLPAAYNKAQDTVRDYRAFMTEYRALCGRTGYEFRTISGGEITPTRKTETMEKGA